MGKLLLGILLLFLWLTFGPEEFTWPSWPAEVVREAAPAAQSDAPRADAVGSSTVRVRYVIDGDTFDIVGGERVRLLGVDTPERDECYYQESTEFVRLAIQDRSVRLEADETDRDAYDRLLRHVFVAVGDGDPEVHLNLRLVEEGYATVLPIPPDARYRDVLAAAEAAAKEAGKGRWGACE